MEKKKFIDLVEDQINELHYELRETKCADSYYEKREAKIEVLELILRLTEDL